MFQLKIESGPINVYMFGSKPYKATTPVQRFGQNFASNHPDGESAWENWWIDKPGQSSNISISWGRITFHSTNYLARILID